MSSRDWESSSCGRCGQYIPAGPLLQDNLYSVREGPVAHVCPPPLPYKVAKAMTTMGPIIVSSRMKARITLGLRGGHDA